MAHATTKIAVSLPADLYRAVETVRKRARLTRSAAVQESLRQWLRTRAQADLVRKYEAGYRGRPEEQREIEAALATATHVLDDGDDW